MDNQKIIEFIQELAQASGEIIRRYFRSGVDVETKSDTTPVTIADRRAEQVMRNLIQLRYPEHGILGEEFDDVNPGAEYQWILDPIDGTKTFISGTYLFGTLIALLRDGKPILGAINNPITKQFLVGDGSTTWLNGAPVKVRDCSSIEQATLLTTSPLNVEKYRDGAAFDALARRARLYRTWGDCHGYYLVATGYADIMVDPAMHIWDVAALIPVIEGAGGTITDYYGKDPMSGEGAVATAGPLHAEVIRALNSDQELR
jgi:histidinol phosphatase-like enzyme (inositol monophosphatase family)